MGEVKAINTIHRILLGAAFTGGGVLAVLAVDSAAHAAEKPPAVQQPGGLLDLPGQAADRAREVVEQATGPEPTETPAPPRDEPEQPAEPEPSEPPVEDRPRDDPAPAEPAPTTPAPTLPPVDVPPVVIDPPAVPPIEVDLPPVEPPAPPVEQPPAEQPTQQPPVVITLPPATTEPLQQSIGPVPATQLPLDGVPLELYPHGIRAAETPVCEDEPRPEPDYERGHVRRILDRITGLHRAKPSRPLKPCPGHDMPPNVTNGAVPAVKPPGGFGADLVADGHGGLHHPTPALLRHCWPRCHLPASRVTCVEPGPA